MKKLKLLKDQFRIGKKGDPFTVRTAAQAKHMVESGIAEEDTSKDAEESQNAETSAGTITTASIFADTANAETVEVSDANTGATVTQEVPTGKKSSKKK